MERIRIRENNRGEYIGVVTFKKDFLETFKNNMEKMIKEKKIFYVVGKYFI